jgi:linoleoyl-CoA desaturase
MVKFPVSNSAEFVEELKREVANYFTARGISEKGNAQMVIKTVVLMAVYFGAYGSILSNSFAPWQLLFLAVIMGITTAGIGFSVGHDALHGAYSSSPIVNKIIGFSFELVGGNGYIWKITHNVIHHTYTNIHGIDEDLEVSPLLRLAPEAEWKPIHRYQHIFAFAAYSFSSLFWAFVKDYKYFLQRNLGPYANKSHPPSAVIVLIVGKLVYYAYTIAIPLAVLQIPFWQFLIGYLAMHLTAGIILGVTFMLAHVVEETDHPIADVDGMMEHDWVVHQMVTTSNFANGNRLLTWYVGGLNHQIEHHLFPKTCSVHYPAIHKIVRDVAAKYDIPYNQHVTLREALRSHIVTLKSLGKGSMVAAPALHAAV